MSSETGSVFRLFFAVDVRCTAPLRKLVIELGSSGRALKAVDPDQLHVTLKFLGATPIAKVPELTAALRATRFSEAFDVALTGLGAFPTVQRPSVIWAGLAPAEAIAAMSEALEAKVEPLGFPREQRPFQPHVTLARARFRPPPNVFALLRDHQSDDWGTVRIDSAVLYRSESTTHGPRYVPLVRVPLGAAPE